MAIDVKQAVRTAAEYIQMLYEGQQLDDLRLEEVERSSDTFTNNWLITFGFNVSATPANALQALAGRQAREYKVVEVDGESGEPLAMRIRQLVA